MDILPAIDLKDGKAVRLSKGLMDSAKIYSDEPWQVAKRFEELGSKWLHIVDLNGAFAGESVNDTGKKVIEDDIFDDDEEEKQSERDIKTISINVYNGLTGIGTKEKQPYPFLEKYFNIFGDKFDMCSMQFALHYMFSDKVTLHNFLVNVSR